MHNQLKTFESSHWIFHPEYKDEQHLRSFLLCRTFVLLWSELYLSNLDAKMQSPRWLRCYTKYSLQFLETDLTLTPQYHQCKSAWPDVLHFFLSIQPFVHIQWLQAVIFKSEIAVFESWSLVLCYIHWLSIIYGWAVLEVFVEDRKCRLKVYSGWEGSSDIHVFWPRH